MLDPAKSPFLQVLLALRVADARLLKAMNKAFQDEPIEPMQALTLVLIWQAEQNNLGMTPGNLARALGQETQSITGLIDRLEARGRITRNRSALDRRVVLLSTTANGAALVERDLFQGLEGTVKLTAAEQEVLKKLLQRVCPKDDTPEGDE